MTAPVLLIVFNRPDKTAAVMSRLRDARPSRLYVAADGPRSNRAGEAERCAATRAVAIAVDWPCAVQTLFRDSNLGCREGVATAIDWFFDNEAEGIILEDDILPTADFFDFCDAMLERYRDDETIGSIAGTNLAAGHAPQTDESWQLTRYPQVWGWASWRRAWANYRLHEHRWAQGRADFRRALSDNRLAADILAELIERTANGEIDTWDYLWFFACQQAALRTAVPAVPLVENIGFGMDATHTFGDTPDYVANARPQPLAFPLIAPASTGTAAMDRLLERHSLGINFESWARMQVRSHTRLAAFLKRVRAAMA